MIQCTRYPDGKIEVSDLFDCAGLMPDIEIVDAIIERCKKSKKEVPQRQRELERDLFFAQSDRPVRAESKKKRKPQKSVVYVMKDNVRGFYKIGFSTNLAARISALKTANPAIEIVAEYPGTRQDEAELHNCFGWSGKHVGGEWFDLNKGDLAYIEFYFSEDNK